MLSRSDVFEECSTCHGSGFRYNNKSDGYDLDCLECIGTGETPTEFGQAILELTERKR